MSSYADHQHLIQQFKLLASKVIPNLRIFDRHVGLFFTKNGDPIRIGMNGQADCWAIYKCKNAKLLLHIELEFKTGKAIQSKDQKNWEKFITEHNGTYLIIRNDSQVYELKKILDIYENLLKLF